MELEAQGLSFEEIVPAIDSFRDNIKTYFVIDNLDTFIKNGRVSKLKGTIASTLNIKPILTGVNGEIEQIGQALGINKAINQLIETVRSKHAGDKDNRIIITHCNCPDRAQKAATALEAITAEEILMLPMRGVSTMYANDGGLIITI